MALLLNVPYAEKDHAKKLGAWWNPELKKWYVKNKSDYPKFRQWISDAPEFFIICDYLYLIEGINICFRCNKETPVIGFGIDTYYEFADPEDLENGYEFCNDSEISIVPHINPIPESLMAYIQEQYNYKIRFSKTTQRSYLANCCVNCDVLQGDFYLFSEVDSPFFIKNEQSAANLTLYRIPLKYDLVVFINQMMWGSNDHLIKRYAKTLNLDIL